MRALMRPGAKPLVFAASLWPFCYLVWGAATSQLGANPAETLVRSTGDWTLRFLCLALAVTPLRVSLGLPALARFRRMLGLFVFFYAAQHLLAYAWFDMGFEFPDIVKDIGKRPFILVGFAGFVGLAAMAATSFNGAIRWLGLRRWQRIHRVVYAIGCMAILHFFWMRAGKNDFAEVAFYAAVMGALLAWRLWSRLRR